MKVRLPKYGGEPTESQKRKLCNKWTRYVLLAVCLALNDLYQFGDTRLGFLIKAVEDILDDYNERSELNGVDAADLMQEELSSRRKIHASITGG